MRVTVKPLEIKAFIPGECFLCKTKCLEGAYVHYECANQYEKRKKEIVDDFFKKCREKREKEIQTTGGSLTSGSSNGR